MNATTTRTTQKLTELGREWTAAEQRGDVATLNRLLADDFMLVGPLGFTLTKEQWLPQISSGALTYDTLTWDEVGIRDYGDAAIAIGRRTQAGTYQGDDIQGQFRQTQIYVQQDGHWRLAGMHLSPIAERP